MKSWNASPIRPPARRSGDNREGDVGHIVWSEGATVMMRRLTPTLRHAVAQRTEYLQRTPRMYARAEDERYPGCRSFWVEDFCHVYYMVAAGGDDCYIMAVEAIDPEEESGSAGADLEQEA